MKRFFLIIISFLLFSGVAMAYQARVIVYPGGLRSKMVEKDSIALCTHPLLSKGIITYKDQADLEAQMKELQDYFSEHPLTKEYQLWFWDRKTNEQIAQTVVGRPKPIRLVENENANTLLMGIITLAVAIVFFLVFLLCNKGRRMKFLKTVVGGLSLLCAVGLAILSVVFLASLGLKMIMMVCGPALIVIVLLLLLVGSSSSARYVTPTQSKDTSVTYSANGRTFNSRQEAEDYVRRNPYAGNGRIDVS